MNAHPRSLLLAAAMTAALTAAAPAFARTSPTASASDTQAVVAAAVTKPQLVNRYATLAGSPTAATTLINDLRNGSAFSVSTPVTTTTTNPDGTTTTSTSTVQQTVVNPNGPMGWGEVNISLALAQALVASGKAPDLQSALTGVTTTVTNPNGTTTTTTSGGILQLRANGMGWGQIAKQQGTSLGAVIRASHTDDKSKGAANHSAKTDDKVDKQKSKHADEPEDAAKAEHADKPEHVAKVEHADTPDRPAKPDRVEHPQKPDHPDHPQKPEHGGH